MLCEKWLFVNLIWDEGETNVFFLSLSCSNVLYGCTVQRWYNQNNDDTLQPNRVLKWNNRMCFSETY